MTCHRGEETGKQEAPFGRSHALAPPFLVPREKSPPYMERCLPITVRHAGIRFSGSERSQHGWRFPVHTPATVRVGCSQSTGGSPSHWRDWRCRPQKRTKSRQATQTRERCPFPFGGFYRVKQEGALFFFFAVWGETHAALSLWPPLFRVTTVIATLESAQTSPPQTRERGGVWIRESAACNPQSPRSRKEKNKCVHKGPKRRKKPARAKDNPFTRFRRTLMHPLIRDVCIAHGSWPIHPRPTAVGVESFSTLRISNARFRGLFALYGLEFWNRHIPIESLLLQSRSAPLGSTKHVFSGLRHQNVLAYARFPGSFPPCTMRGSAGFATSTRTCWCPYTPLHHG